jgi:hypothetical protein
MQLSIAHIEWNEIITPGDVISVPQIEAVRGEDTLSVIVLRLPQRGPPTVTGQ